MPASRGSSARACRPRRSRPGSTPTSTSSAASPFEPAKPVANGISARSLPDMIGAEHRLVFVNGHFRKDLSAVCMPPEGATVTTLAEAIATHPELVERAIALNGGKGANAFHTLNTAFMTDGLFLHLADGVQLPSVIEVIHVSVGENTPVFHHPRNVILAETESSATVVGALCRVGYDGDAVQHRHARRAGRGRAPAPLQGADGRGGGVPHRRARRRGRQGCRLRQLLFRLGRQAVAQRDPRPARPAPAPTAGSMAHT